jgi:nucleotide sugar dehydrogenase
MCDRNNVSVIGIGRLGLCTALCLERGGYNVVGVDVFPSYVEALNNKTFKSTEPRVEEFLQASKNFKATTSIDEAISHSDLLLVFVATPSTGGERHYDHSMLGKVLMDINSRKVSGKHVVIGCTVIPGYISETGRYLLRDCTNTSLSYHPEFIAQGDIIRGTLRPDMSLIGEGSKAAGDYLEEVNKKMCENEPVISRMSPESAEITKLSINCFVTMKISYSNMIGDIADRTPNANKFDILSAVGADSRVGRKYLTPGYGFGGPCFPRDNRALGGYAETVGVEPILPVATDAYNKLHAKYQLKDLIAQNKDIYVFTGIGYKDPCPVPIIEESQKLVLASGLVRAGKRVLLRDRDFLIRAAQLEFGKMFEYEVVPADQPLN